jgi:uncharacterized protein
MKIILPGGTGQIGHILLRAFTRAGHTCVVLTRDPVRSTAELARLGLLGSARAVAWDARTLGSWTAEFEGAGAVVNLAGRSVNCRYTEANLDRMLRSRTDSTRVIGEAIATAHNPPRVWLNSSTATIYAHAAPGDPPRDERTGPVGGTEPGVPPHWKRSVEIGLAWEAALFAAATPRTRRVALRSAMVMSPDRGGVFSAFATLCRFGMGRQGDGGQYVSWIHEYDFVAALHFILAHDEIEGVVNLAAPEPLPNRDFIAALHSALGRDPRLRVPAPAWLLELGAFFQRTETELLLKSRRVVPARLHAAGFRFRHPVWPEAARELAARWRGQA